MFKIGVNGFGTIGSRVAAAIEKQKDMKLVGISELNPSWKTRHANIPIFLSLKEYGKSERDRFKKRRRIFNDSGIKTKGTIRDLMHEVDLIVDATPKRIGEKNKEELYSEKEALHAIFQGGEKASVAKITFNAHVNYEDAIGQRYLRIPSCNTTAILRYLNDIQEISDVKEAIINLIRRGADPPQPDSGPINDYVPTGVPSHHAEDVIDADSRLNGKLITFGVKVPVTLMHMHNIVAIGKFPSRSKILDAFYNDPRLIVVGGEGRIPTAAQILEANERKNLYQVVILEKTLNLHGNRLLFSAYVHQEADVIPENIDAIRASLGVKDAHESINMTNKNLRIGKTKKKIESYFPVS